MTAASSSRITQSALPVRMIFLYESRIVALHDRRLVVTVRDITERKQAEEERVRFMSAVEQAAEVILITDTADTIQYVNPAFGVWTGTWLVMDSENQLTRSRAGVMPIPVSRRGIAW